MNIKQLSIFVENKQGRLADITEILSKANANIRALSIADTTDFGILRLIVDTPESAALALKEAGIRVEVDYSDINMRDKIKRFKNMKDPYILVLGNEEAAAEEVSVNVRGSNQQVRNVPLTKFIEKCKQLNADRTLELPSEF